MKSLLLSLFCLALAVKISAQANMLITNPAAEKVILGNFNPNDYAATVQLDQPEQIVQTILEGVSPDSMKAYLLELSTFQTRNTGSDTLSQVRGIGAARRWVFQKFSQFGQASGGRLLPAYFQFDQAICAVGQHRNVIAVLPGSDTSAHGVVLLEAHLDSRCKVLCDTACLAEGMEDNGSGTALVIELARVMHKLSFKNTLVFMATIGEEQGLVGAEAFAKFAKEKNIPLRAVLNNDVIGGVICGETSSPPSCPGFNHVDSTQVRLFSSGNNNSKHKQLARFIKLEYSELVKPGAAVPMLVTIMSAEDRTGRGGDHIPFREQGFTAMRFTSANEHGDAGVTDPGYHDRQHTSEDILGVDTDGDQLIDSFFVDFNYLTRNANINGVAAGMAAIGVRTPTFTAGKLGDSVVVEITDPLDYGEYRIFFRFSGHDFDSVFTVFQKNVTLPKPPPNTFWVSVAAVDQNGTESLFTGEVNPGTISATGEASEANEPAIELLQNRPNPFDEATYISFLVRQPVQVREAFVLVSDLQGKEIKRLPVQVRQGMNEVLYEHGYNVTGAFLYSLVLDGKVVDTKRMVFAN